MKCSIWKHT